MPTGYQMVMVRNVVSNVTKEMYLKEANEYLYHPWFSQFYVIEGASGYGYGAYGSIYYGS